MKCTVPAQNKSVIPGFVPGTHSQFVLPQRGLNPNESKADHLCGSSPHAMSASG